jgi:hypothetical protein
MSRLFIELYLDEDVDVLIAQLLRARGFVVVTTQEAGQLRKQRCRAVGVGGQAAQNLAHPQPCALRGACVDL